MRREVAAVLRMSREEFQRATPAVFAGVKLHVNNIPPSSRTHIGLERPPGQTVIYVEDVTPEQIRSLIEWGKTRVAGIHRVSQIFQTDVYSEEDLCSSDYVFCEFVSGKVKIANEADAFSSQRCATCGRMEFVQVGDIAIEKRLGSSPFYLTPSCDLIVAEQLSQVFSACGVNTRAVKGASADRWQIAPAPRFKFAPNQRHQHLHNMCAACGKYLGVIFDSSVEGNWRISETSDLTVNHTNNPVVAVVPSAAIGREHMLQAPQSLFGNLGIPAYGAVVRPYGRNEMKTAYIMSGKLVRSLREAVGWKALREFISTPAILKGDA